MKKIGTFAIFIILIYSLVGCSPGQNTKVDAAKSFVYAMTSKDENEINAVNINKANSKEYPTKYLLKYFSPYYKNINDSNLIYKDDSSKDTVQVINKKNNKVFVTLIMKKSGNKYYFSSLKNQTVY